MAVVIDQELALGIDGVRSVGEGELEHLRLGDRLGRARLDAQVAMDAAKVVDLVDVAVALARRHRVVRRVVETAHVDAVRRTHAGAQLAADALLHAVLVAVEDVAAVLARLLRTLDRRVAARHAPPREVPEREREPPEEREVAALDIVVLDLVVRVVSRSRPMLAQPLAPSRRLSVARSPDTRGSGARRPKSVVAQPGHREWNARVAASPR